MLSKNAILPIVLDAGEGMRIQDFTQPPILRIAVWICDIQCYSEYQCERMSAVAFHLETLRPL